MSIQYEKETGIFHLTTAYSSYQMQVDSYGHLLHLYYGKRTMQSAGHVLTYYDRGFCGNPGEAGRSCLFAGCAATGISDQRNRRLSCNSIGVVGCGRNGWM